MYFLTFQFQAKTGKFFLKMQLAWYNNIRILSRSFLWAYLEYSKNQTSIAEGN